MNNGEDYEEVKMQKLFFTPIRTCKLFLLCVLLWLVACSMNLQSGVSTKDENQILPTLSAAAPILPVESASPVPTKSMTPNSFATPTNTLEIVWETETLVPSTGPTTTEGTIVPDSLLGPIIKTEQPETASGLFLFSPLVTYRFIEQMANDFSQPIYIDDLHLPLGSQAGPAQGYDLAFSNHANLMAYWTVGPPSNLFISDLSNQTQYLIFSDTSHAYRIGEGGEVRLLWSPDDMHLIVDEKNDVERDFIYHLQTGVLEPWPYDCDRIAWSPKSGRMTTWCISLVEAPQFAVLEWGGEVWYSQERPADELVHRKAPPVRLGVEEKPLVWGWSPSGEKVAFYDPDDPSGNLYIANADGNIHLSIPGKAYWLVDNDPVELPPYDPIRWSFSENRILIYGAGEEKFTCPPWKNIFDESPVTKPVPCWQVIDATNGETLWTISDSLEGIFYGADVSIAQNFTFLNASLSPDGKYLALFSYVSGAKNLNIIELDSHKVLRGWDFDAPLMRWSNRP